MVNVIGLGYVGLPTALALAARGVDVVGVDVNASRVAKLRAGEVDFSEPGMNELFARAQRCGIRFETAPTRADFYIVAVPTPCDSNGRKIDATFLLAAARELARVAPKGAVVVVESTVSPGVINFTLAPVFEACGRRVGVDLHLAHAPERIIPGKTVEELTRNARVVGADSRAIAERVKALYQSFCQGEIVLSDVRTAEMCKVVENTFRAVNIAFANELAKIARRAGLDVYEIIRICNMHPRVDVLAPGPGVGGHCVAVDPRFLVADYPDLAKLVDVAINVNDSMPDFVLDRVCEIMRELGMTDPERVGLYGLAYKENVDDARESPTLQLLELQRRRLATPLKVYDPCVLKDVAPRQYHSFDKFLDDVDFVVVMVAHDELRKNLDKLKGKVVLDCKNACGALCGVADVRRL